MSVFSHDSDLAYFMLSSGLLNKACNAICDTPVSFDDRDPPFSINFQVSETSDHKIIFFRSSLSCNVKDLEEEGKDVAPPNEKFFNFTDQKVNPAISINKIALDVFDSLFEDYLCKVQEQIVITKPLLVTGNALGGSIASLFTLYLLDKVYATTTSKWPICITFGSPLLGNLELQKAIYKQTSWPPCFIHVALSHDPIPKLFGLPNYEPFGLFLFCSEFGCACVDQPESVKEIIVALRRVEDLDLSGFQINHYRRALIDLKNKGMPELGGSSVDSLLLGISLDLQAIGVLKIQEELNNDIKRLIDKMKTTKVNGIARKRNEPDKKRKLNEIKISMTYLEWYKKKTVEDGGYYDAYKKPDSLQKRRSRDRIRTEKTKLELYWKNMVNEAKQKPRKDAVTFHTGWIFAGTAYRRMVEPLHIADHYSSGKTDYINTARPEYFTILEKLFDDDKKRENRTNLPVQRKKVAVSLSEDSCFWAHVEEAVISLDVITNIQSCDVEKNAAMIKLKDFEDYAMRLFEGYVVSPEIFLPNSTFMVWWGKYKLYKDGTTRGGLYTSPLANL